MPFYIVRRCRGGLDVFIGLGKLEPFVTDGDAVGEPGPLWFEFGDTEQEARQKIETEMRSMMN